jgi:hypothetical protein
VASANRGVLGGFASDEDVEDVEAEEFDPADMVRAGVRFRAVGRFFSSLIAMAASSSSVWRGDNKESKEETSLRCCNKLCERCDSARPRQKGTKRRIWRVRAQLPAAKKKKGRDCEARRRREGGGFE